jgi:hypothetical protein
MSNYREDKLTLSYNKRQKDFIIAYPRRCDGALILNTIIGDILKWGGIVSNHKEPYNFEVFNLKEELERRGYDLTTLKFSIELKK